MHYHDAWGHEGLLLQTLRSIDEKYSAATSDGRFDFS